MHNCDDSGGYSQNSRSTRNSDNNRTGRGGVRIGASRCSHQTPTTVTRKFGTGSHTPNLMTSMSPDTAQLDHEPLNKLCSGSNRTNNRSQSLQSNSNAGNGKGNGNNSGGRRCPIELTGAILAAYAFNRFNVKTLKLLLISQVLQDESGKVEHKSVVCSVC